jgi:hypothetical protein
LQRPGTAPGATGDSEVLPEVLEDTRALLMKLTGKRKIDETPAALSGHVPSGGVARRSKPRANAPFIAL